MKYFFCYEQANTGLWGPVLYHGEKPKIKDGYIMSSNGVQNAVTDPVELEYDFEPPSFHQLSRLYPRKGAEMPRPIEGYYSKDGKFFETEDEAVVHEAVYGLSTTFIEKLRELKINITEQMRDKIIMHSLQFIGENSEEIVRYIEASKRIESRGVPEASAPETATKDEVVSTSRPASKRVS